MREVLIDLGDDWEIPAPPVVARPPADPVTRRRTALMSLLAVLIVPTVMGAAPKPAVPAITELASITYPGPRGAVAFAGQDLILVSAGNGNIVGFDLHGKVMWRAKLDDLPAITTMQKVHDSVVVVADKGTDASVTTTAFNPRTGERRWFKPGSLELVGDAAILTHQQASISVFDAATMRQRWSLADAASHAFLTTSETGRDAMLVLTKAGIVQIRDLSTGAVLASRQVQLPPAIGYRIRVSRGAAVILRILDNGDATDGLWLDAWSLAQIPIGVHWAAWRDCGLVWCGQVRGSSRPSIVDKQTGQILRTLGLSQNAIGTPAGVMTMMYRSDGTYSAINLFDPLSGQVLSSLRGWQTVATENYTNIAHLLVWPSNGKSHLAVIRSNGLRVLGQIKHEVFGCLLEGPVLLCSTTEGKLGLWAVHLP
ncbi:MAG TPA: PQQ-binding-like beta-propeller repeat protein [Candidatus Limnocylindrales bacterium]